MKRLVISAFLIIYVCMTGNAADYLVVNPSKLSRSRLKLCFDWDYYKGRFVSPSEIDDVTADAVVRAPYIWMEDFQMGLGCGTFRLSLKGLYPNKRYAFFAFDAIGTSYNFFVNGNLVAVVGKPNEDYEKATPDQSMNLIDVCSDSDGRLDIVIQVSNNFHRKGGLWGRISFAEYEYMQKFFLHGINKQFALIGMLLCIFIFHLILYLLKRSDKSSLYLSLFIFVLTVRLCVQGFSVVKYYIPSFPYSLALKMEYMALYAAPAFYAMYLRGLYGRNYLPQGLDIYIYFFNMILLVIAWVCDIGFVNRLIPLMEMDVLVCAALLAYMQFRMSAINRQQFNTAVMAIASSIVALFALHDILVLNNVTIVLSNANLLPYSVIFFVAAQSIITAFNREAAFREVKEYSMELEEKNEIYYKFIPREFLALFGKKNITDESVSEKKTCSLTLLSANISDLAQLRKHFSDNEIFTILNKYLSVVSSIVRSNGGFIDKYLGSGILALFAQHGENAVKCAKQMEEAIDRIYKELNKDETQKFHLSIGIHYGQVELITVDEADHKTGLTISNSVNTVLKLEDLTKKYDKSILVSKSYIDNAKFEEKYDFVYVDKIVTDDEDTEEELYTV